MIQYQAEFEEDQEEDCEEEDFPGEFSEDVQDDTNNFTNSNEEEEFENFSDFDDVSENSLETMENTNNTIYADHLSMQWWSDMKDKIKKVHQETNKTLHPEFVPYMEQCIKYGKFTWTNLTKLASLLGIRVRKKDRKKDIITMMIQQKYKYGI